MIYLGIPTLNRYDLCEQAISAACRGVLTPDRIYVVDNGGKLRQGGYVNPEHTVEVTVLKPGKNLGVGPSWNLLARTCLTGPDDLLLISGDDVTLHADALNRLVITMDRTGADLCTPDPALSTTPQMFSCFMVRKALFDKVGFFDERFWPAYFEDNDFHRRMRFAHATEAVAPCGYDHVNSGTMKAYSKDELEQHHIRFRACRDYYIEKWGGLPGEERFHLPFNGQPDPAKLSF